MDARPCNAALSRRWPLCEPRSSPPASRALFNLARRGEVRRLSSDSAALGRAKDGGLREVKGTERHPDTPARQRKQAGSEVQQRKCTNNIKCLTKTLTRSVVQFRSLGELSVSGELRAQMQKRRLEQSLLIYEVFFFFFVNIDLLNFYHLFS